MSQGSNPRYIVTHLVGDPKQLYQTVYCARGEMENRIKEQQLDLFADRTRWLQPVVAEPIPLAVVDAGLCPGQCHPKACPGTNRIGKIYLRYDSAETL